MNKVSGGTGRRATGRADGFSIFNDVSHSDTVQQIECAGFGRGLERGWGTDASAVISRWEGSLRKRKTDENVNLFLGEEHKFLPYGHRSKGKQT